MAVYTIALPCGTHTGLLERPDGGVVQLTQERDQSSVRRPRRTKLLGRARGQRDGIARAYHLDAKMALSILPQPFVNDLGGVGRKARMPLHAQVGRKRRDR